MNEFVSGLPPYSSGVSVIFPLQLNVCRSYIWVGERRQKPLSVKPMVRDAPEIAVVETEVTHEGIDTNRFSNRYATAKVEAGDRQTDLHFTINTENELTRLVIEIERSQCGNRTLEFQQVFDLIPRDGLDERFVTVPNEQPVHEFVVDFIGHAGDYITIAPCDEY